MGTDASNSVTNSFGQTHELANLYIAGGGLFPTEGAVNPTNTIMAVTLRGAEHMVKNFSARSRAERSCKVERLRPRHHRGRKRVLAGANALRRRYGAQRRFRPRRKT